jgi:hypothetical protein
MKISQIAVLITLLGISVISASVEAQKIKVLVLDDLSGKPYEGIEVTYTCDGHMWVPSQKTKTDASGLAEVKYACAAGEKFFIGTYIKGDRLAECGELEAQALQKILEVGVISNPKSAGGIWCPAKVSKKVKPVPGEVILFVKKPTWRQIYIAP